MSSEHIDSINLVTVLRFHGPGPPIITASEYLKKTGPVIGSQEVDCFKLQHLPCLRIVCTCISGYICLCNHHAWNYQIHPDQFRVYDFSRHNQYGPRSGLYSTDIFSTLSNDLPYHFGSGYHSGRRGQIGIQNIHSLWYPEPVVCSSVELCSSI